MNARNDPVPPGRPGGGDANERFKRGARMRLHAGLIAATAAHFLVFAFGPTWSTPEEQAAFAPPAEMQAIGLSPEIELPSLPPRVAPPELPVVEELKLAEELRIEPVADFEPPTAFVVLPEPPAVPAGADGELAEYEHFMPYMVRPELKNRSEVQRALERRYPNVLRMGNVEGAVVVVFWIDERGAVQKYEIRRSSGSRALDRAVEDVIEIMEFRPALNRGEPVKVIVALPIRFQLY